MDFKAKQKRLVIIFSILILIALLAVVFIYFYRHQADAMIKKYVNKIAICGLIDNEDDCYNNEFCEGIYQPKCFDCSEIEFTSCHRVSDKLEAELKAEKRFCEDSGGKWHRNKLGSFCLCGQNGSGLVFDKVKGCINK
jgi:hypothetical protein